MAVVEWQDLVGTEDRCIATLEGQWIEVFADETSPSTRSLIFNTALDLATVSTFTSPTEQTLTFEIVIDHNFSDFGVVSVKMASSDTYFDYPGNTFSGSSFVSSIAEGDGWYRLIFSQSILGVYDKVTMFQPPFQPSFTAYVKELKFPDGTIFTFSPSLELFVDNWSD